MKPAVEAATGPSQLGTRIHAALEAHFGYGIEAGTALALIYLDAAEKWMNDQDLHSLREESELAHIMVDGYLEWERQSGREAQLRVVAVEKDVTVPIEGLDGVALRAKLDQVVYDELTGELRFRDWKTAANFDKHEILALDPQFRTYSVIQSLARLEGSPLVRGGILSTLRRVKRSSASKPPYYQRDEFEYNDKQLRATLRGARSMAIEIVGARQGFDEIRQAGNELHAVDAAQQVVTYPNPRLNDCRWDCPFTALCPMMDDGSDWTGALVRSGAYVQGDPYDYYGHSLLEVIRNSQLG